MALGVPRRAFIRRKKAPKALCEWCKLRAARRRGTVTRWAPGRTRRDSTLPPEIVCWGPSPSQLQECFTLGQPGHVGADLAEDDHGRAFFDALDGRQVDAGHAIQGGTGIKPRVVALFVATGLGGQGLAIAVITKGRQMRFDLLVASGDLLVIDLIQLDGLA